jgi:hypothetical protein
MKSTSSERAARRRAEWTGGVVSPGTPKPRLYDDLTPEERLAALARLNRLAWRAGGGAEPLALPRSEWPGEIFELRGG